MDLGLKNLSNYSSAENIGTVHWYRTLVGNAKRIGEYMKNQNLTSDLQQRYGEEIYNIMQDLLEWQEFKKDNTGPWSKNDSFSIDETTGEIKMNYTKNYWFISYNENKDWA